MSTVSDYDGNSYSTVTINGVEWLSTNLKTKHLYDGTAIKLYDGRVFPNADGVNNNHDLWYNGNEPMYAYAGNDPTSVATYGLLYNFAAVATAKLIPSAAYHVATYAEWLALITYYTTAALAGAALKQAGVTTWDYPNTGAANTSGFGAIPAGWIERDGAAVRLAKTAAFWTATTDTTGYLDQPSAKKFYMVHDSADLSYDISKVSCGLSVRCIKT